MIESIQSLIHTVAVGLLVLSTIPLTMTMIRLMSGPGYADRFVALDMLTGIAVSMAALACIVSGQREYLDVAFGLALFGFIGTCALAAFLERKGAPRK